MSVSAYFCMFIQLAVLIPMTCLSPAPLYDEPTWKKALKTFPKWTGYYVKNEHHYSCSLYVHSVQSGVQGTAMLTFRDRDTVMDVTAFSYDRVTVMIKLESIHIPSARFPGDVDFQIEGKIDEVQGIWTLSGNITEPKHEGFSTFLVTAHGLSSETITETKSSSLTIGLAVGIPLALVILFLIISILLIMWAVRKGYLRHVPRSFKILHNPPDSDVRLQNGAVTVHM